jgi:hypothetical protein
MSTSHSEKKFHKGTNGDMSKTTLGTNNSVKDGGVSIGASEI